MLERLKGTQGRTVTLYANRYNYEGSQRMKMKHMLFPVPAVLLTCFSPTIKQYLRMYGDTSELYIPFHSFRVKYVMEWMSAGAALEKPPPMAPCYQNSLGDMKTFKALADHLGVRALMFHANRDIRRLENAEKASFPLRHVQVV